MFKIFLFLCNFLFAPSFNFPQAQTSNNNFVDMANIYTENKTCRDDLLRPNLDVKNFGIKPESKTRNDNNRTYEDEKFFEKAKKRIQYDSDDDDYDPFLGNCKKPGPKTKILQIYIVFVLVLCCFLYYIFTNN